jgi:plasmid maintenance system antidote protein VapI
MEVTDPRSVGLADRPAHCTKAHAAREIGISRQRIQQLVDAKHLLTVNLAGHTYILTASLDRYLIQRRII